MTLEVGSNSEASQRTMGADKELDLIRRVAAKDRLAFEELYRLYYRRLFSFLLRFTRRSDLIEEILNDAMFAVWQNAAGFREQSRVSTWIFGIAYRKALKSIRRHERHSREVSPEEAGLYEQGRTDPTLERRVLRDALQGALDKLSPEHRAVVELTYYHGYSYPEISEIVSCPVNTVKTRMFHARRHLRKMVPHLRPGPANRDSGGAP